MSLKLTVDSLDGLDDSVKPLYVADGEKFKLNVDGVEDTSSLKGALAKERAARQEAEKEVKRWKRLGKSDDEIAELIEAQASAEDNKAAQAGEWDKLKAKMVERHQADLAKKDDSIGQLRRAMERHLIDATATQAIAAAKGVPDLLLPHVQRSVRVTEENGEFSVNVVDAKGDPRVNSKGEPLTISDLVSEMRQSEIFGRAFEASGQSGSGTRPSSNGGAIPLTKRRSEFKTERERSQFVNEHGLDAYKALPL